MKAVSSFKNAVSAAALSAALVVPTALAGQFALVSAASAAVVNSIDVKGNQRVDAATICSYLGIKPGQSFSNVDIDEAVKRLFATGMFSDVRVNQVGSTLVVQVDEHAIVNQVLFQGNKKIKDAQLASTVQLKPRSAFSNEAVESDAEAIRQAYARVGRDDATVTSQVMQLGEGRVNVVFNITEGGRTKISHLDFVGNSAFGKRRLSDVISTKKSSVLSVLLRDDIYDENRLRADEEALRRFYYNRGYADFQVVSSTADLDAATNSYNITITVDEGARYKFGDIGVESTIPGVDGESLALAPQDALRTGLQRRGRRGHNHRADRAHGGARLRIRSGYAARRSQFREPYDLGRPIRSTKVRAHMSSGSKSVATLGRATTWSVASSTSAKATPSIRFSSNARRSGWRSLDILKKSRFRRLPAPSPTR